MKSYSVRYKAVRSSTLKFSRGRSTNKRSPRPKRVCSGACCWFCGSPLIWGGDHSYEDYGLEGEGIVANLSCSKCNARAEFYQDIPD